MLVGLSFCSFRPSVRRLANIIANGNPICVLFGGILRCGMCFNCFNYSLVFMAEIQSVYNCLPFVMRWDYFHFSVFLLHSAAIVPSCYSLYNWLWDIFVWLRCRRTGPVSSCWVPQSEDYATKSEEPFLRTASITCTAWLYYIKYVIIITG